MCDFKTGFTDDVVWPRSQKQSLSESYDKTTFWYVILCHGFAINVIAFFLNGHRKDSYNYLYVKQ